MHRVGPFEWIRELFRAPGVIVAEARDQDGRARLVQMIPLAAGDPPSPDLEALERRVAQRTAALLSETPVAVHGSAVDPDGARVLYWSLPWFAGAAEPLVVSADRACGVVMALATLLGDRHRRGEVHPVLSAPLVRLDATGRAVVLGVPVAVDEKWLGPGVEPPPLAPEEASAEQATPAGDLWRLGRVIRALSESAAADGSGADGSAARSPVLESLAAELTGDPGRRPSATDVFSRVSAIDEVTIEAMAFGPVDSTLAGRSMFQTSGAPPRGSSGIATVVEAAHDPTAGAIPVERLESLESNTDPDIVDVVGVRQRQAESVTDAEVLVDDLPILSSAEVHSLEPSSLGVGPVEYMSANDSTEEHRTIRAIGGEAVLPAEAFVAPLPPAEPTDRISTDIIRERPPSDRSAEPPPPAHVPSASPVEGLQRVSSVPADDEPMGSRGPDPRLPSARPATSRRTLAAGLAIAVGALVGIVAVFGGSSKPAVQSAARALIRPDNQLELSSDPPGAEVIAEADGRLLGRTPVRMMVPSQTEVAVLVDAPERVPVRVVLPEHGALRVALPKAPAEYCEVQVETQPGVRLDEHRGTQSVPGTVAVAAGAVFRRQGAGRRVGARLVRCHSQADGRTDRLRIELEPARVYSLWLTGPAGLRATVDGRAVGPLPVSVQSEKSFLEVRIEDPADPTGRRLARWVGLAADTEIVMPSPSEEARPLQLPFPPPIAGQRSAGPPTSGLDGHQGKHATKNGPPPARRKYRRAAKKQLRRARRALASGKTLTARNGFRRCLKLDPDVPECHRGLAATYRRLKRTERSNFHYRRYLELRPEAEDAPRIRRLLDESSPL